MWKYATKQVFLHIKKWKTNRNEVTYNSCIKSKIRRKLENLRKACKKKISEFIFNLIPRASNLYGTFDDEGLLHGHYYWKSERPGDIKLPDRQFLNPHKKAGCFSYRDEVFIWKILFLLLPRQDAKHPGFI